jgi:Xaa-Pro aminopeptidase
MKNWEKKLTTVQQSISKAGWDGWLLYDFRNTNDLACRFLEIPKGTMQTRRFFYWIPKTGKPMKIVHRIESHVLDHLPGEMSVFSSYEELEKKLQETLSKASKIAMEYSPYNAIPTVSKVDAGTADLIRRFGVEIESSANLLQHYTSIWTQAQFESHLAASEVLQNAVEKAWKHIAEALKTNTPVDEADIQQLILEEFELHNCIADDPPICAVNANSANPHYTPEKGTAQKIQRGDFVLIDTWCKKNTPHSVYADITRVAVISQAPTKRHQEIFDVVKAGRDAAIALLKERRQAKKLVMGWEVDQACRDVIIQAGYGEYFTHRTGHNIGERDHGDGANIDNFETKDFRSLLSGTCFSIEPGIYLPGEFGVRLEDDVFLHVDDEGMHITPGLQDKIYCID